ncbi:hypothetical protein BH09PSE1_BH09PSE1_02720 [soil metagenome]
MPYQQLVYVSRSTIPLMSPLDVADILEQSARNNALYRTTGALTYCGDRFLQLIEGPPASLGGLMPALRADPRHSDIDVLGHVTVRERLFPEWTMIFPMFTPGTAAELATALEAGRRHMTFYRDLMLRMTREQATTLRGRRGSQRP